MRYEFMLETQGNTCPVWVHVDRRDCGHVKDGVSINTGEGWICVSLGSLALWLFRSLVWRLFHLHHLFMR